MADPSIIQAECPTCGKRGFRAPRESLQPGDILTCESCGLKLSYAFLQTRLAPAGAAPERRALQAPAKRAKKRKTAKTRARKRA
jgi:DNA-directed RNA polymerase subunit RPC12/RpoP